MTSLTANGRRVEITHPDKVLFPRTGLTKLDLARYYRRAAGYILPHVADRPLTLQRFPDGIQGAGFYQKDASDFFPDWIKTVEIEKREGGTFDAPLCNDAATLVYLANLASIPLHMWLSTVRHLDRPDRVIVDLDPSGDDFGEVRFAAGVVREYCIEKFNISPFLMTTGSRGLHVVMPVKPEAGFDEIRKRMREAAGFLAQRHDDRLTTEARKNKRKGRVYLDVARNAFGQTVVAPYCVRAKEGAPVATPLDWHELGRLPHARKYTVNNLFRRLAAKPDPWKNLRET